MGSINSQGVYEYDVTDDEIGPVLLNRQSAALTNLFTGRANTVRVANVSQRAAALAAHGTPSTSNPLIVFRADAGAGRELEYTTNGTLWHTVPAEEDTGWVNITSFGSGFSAGSVTPQVRLKDGIVWFRGEIDGAIAPGSSAQVCTIPSGFLPQETSYWPAPGSTNSNLFGRSFISSVSGGLTIHLSASTAGGLTLWRLNQFSYPIN